MHFTKDVLPDFDFSGIQGLSQPEVLDDVLGAFRSIVAENQPFFPAPLLPEPGGSDSEIDQLEASLGIVLPTGYRAFLRRAKYATLDDGFEVWGLKHNGTSYGEGLWVSEKHDPGQRFLVFGYYWGFADGDQLLMPIGLPTQPVVLYLHEHGPKFEVFAPSFLHGLWRLAAERSSPAA